MRNKAPGTAATGPHEYRINNVRDSMNAKDLIPEFRYDTANISDTAGPDTNGGKQIWLRGARSAGSDECIVLPFRERGPESDLALQQICLLDDWLLDLSTTGIDEANRIGGIIDGQAIAQGDYWIYAFLDPEAGPGSQFKGFGLMRRPFMTYIVSAGSGAKGGVFQSQFGAGTGFQFALGARVIVREKSPAFILDTGGGSTVSNADITCAYPTNGSGYNQGSVTTRVTAGIITQLDNANITVNGRQVGYGNVIPTGAPDGEVLQVTNPEPWLWAEDSLYPGGGTQYQFCYMGSVYVDAGLNIGYTPRKRGDLYVIPGGGATFFDETAVGVTTFYNRHLARFLPVHAHNIDFQVSYIRTAGAGALSMFVHPNENDLTGLLDTGATVDGGFKLKRDEAEQAPFSASVSLRITVPGGTTGRGVVVAWGYEETEW